MYRNAQTLVSNRKHYHATCSHIHQVRAPQNSVVSVSNYSQRVSRCKSRTSEREGKGEEIFTSESHDRAGTFTPPAMAVS